MLWRQNDFTQSGFGYTQRSLRETFTYDNLDRLTNITPNISTATPMNYSYDGTGSILSKTENTSNPVEYMYSYNLTDNPSGHFVPAHGVSEITPALPDLAPIQSISYTPFNKIDEISEGDELLSTDYTHLKYYYGIDNQRRKMIEDRFDAGVQSSHRVKYYSGNFESETINLAGVVSSREINYIFAPDGLAAIYEMKNGTGKMYYVSTDNLGSINMIADAQGNIVNDLSYDAWGRRRDPFTWETLTTTQLKTLQPTLITDRGYTMHEHIDAFGLINMNGRAYDPLVGQFLSPDPFVQAGEYTQSYNRYSYCWNNPLKYSDPSGYVTINLDGLIFSMNSNWRFYQFLGDNWDNISSLSSTNGINITWGEMKDLQGKFSAGKNYLHERGMWYDYSYYYSTEIKNKSIGNGKQGNINSQNLISPIYTASTFIPLEDFFRGIEEISRFAGDLSFANIGSNINNSLGGFGEGLKYTPGTFQFNRGAKYPVYDLKFKYHPSGWGGGTAAFIKTFKMPFVGKMIGRGTIGVSLIFSAIDINKGIRNDGGEFGKNAVTATSQAVFSFAGSVAGAEYGAYIGASVGVWYFGVGAAPGAIIGGIIGAIGGGFLGNEVGEEFATHY